MRLFEIFEDTASPANVKVVADTLDARAYQPADKVAKNAPVLDIEIPTSGHFIQRYNQRSDIAKFSLKDVFNLLYRAKTDPSLGFAKELDALAREDDPEDDVVVKGSDNLTIPLIVKPNPEAVKTTPNNPVAMGRRGNKVPRNQAIVKTIYRKGVND